MEDKSVKRRNWIKNIAIIFLTIMLILTLFSQTFMNMSLPEVATQYSRSGSITTQIRNSGTVKARDTYVVVAENSTKIKDVGVKEGAQVQIGDTLYILEDDGSDQLIAEYEKLAKYKTDYNDTLALVSPDYSAKLLDISYAEKDLANAKTELAKANTKKAQAVSNDTALSDAKAKSKEADTTYKEIKKQYDKLDLKISTLQGKIDNLEKAGVEYNDKESPTLLLTKAQGDYQTLEKNIATAEANQANAEKAVNIAEDNFDRAKDILEDKTEAETEASSILEAYKKESGVADVSDETVRAKERTLEQLEFEYDYLIQDYQSAIRKNDAAVAELKEALNSATMQVNIAFQQWYQDGSPMSGTTKDALDSAVEAQKKAENTYNAAVEDSSSVRAAKKTLESKEMEIKIAKEDLQREKDKLKEASPKKLQEYKDALSAATQAKKSAEKDVSAAEKARTEAETNQTKAKNALKELKEEKLPIVKSTVELYEHAVSLESLNVELALLEIEVNEAEIKKEKAEETYKDLSDNNSTTSAIETEIKTAEKTVATCEKTLKEKELELAELKDKASKNSGANEGKLKALEESIKAQEERVAELSDSERTSKVTAPVAGTVTSVKFSAGQSINLGETIAEIQLTEKGYLVSFSVSTDQASKIKPGDTATVQNYWGSNITAVVDSIQPDTANPTKSRTVNIAVSGDVTIGATLTFAIGQRSQNFDCVVPNVAIREDSDGKYVLVVDAKSTPLGNRYTARKVPVQVVASDDSNSAVTGLSYSEVVITTSSAPIESGMQVRLPES